MAKTNNNKLPQIELEVTISGRVGYITNDDVDFEYNFIGEVSDFQSNLNADIGDYVKKICDAIKDVVVKHEVKENGI